MTLKVKCALGSLGALIIVPVVLVAVLSVLVWVDSNIMHPWLAAHPNVDWWGKAITATLLPILLWTCLYIKCLEWHTDKEKP